MFKLNSLKTVAFVFIVSTILPLTVPTKQTFPIPPVDNEITDDSGIMPMSDLPPQLK